MRPLQIKPLIDFFKTCLPQEKNFTVNIEVSKESEELYNSHREINNFKTVEEFISNAPLQILLKGITIKLQTNIKDIDLGNLHKIKSFLNKKLKCAEETKGEKQSQDTPQAEKTKSEKERNIVQEENIQDTVSPVNKKIIKIGSKLPKLYCEIKKYFQLCSGIRITVSVYVDK